MIKRIRRLAVASATAYVAARERLGYPLLLRSRGEAEASDAEG
jgi:hypothetical protein